ncbi:MAG: prepilin peptidase [Deltaproteobacteria bacterium]|nr:prepilin peptidase [Deltaproteobacteria bacterium]
MTIILVAIFGLVVGSYLGSLSYRIPRKHIKKWYEEENLEELNVSLEEDPEVVNSPRSKCPNCKKTLNWWELIPVFSYVLLRGRCSGCRQEISPSYVIIELTTALTAVLTYVLFGISVEAVLLFVLLSVLLLASSIDFKCYILPDFLTLPVAATGVVYCVLLYLNTVLLKPPFSNHALDSFSGGIIIPVFLIVFSWIFEKIRQKEGFGFGDIKLLSGIGFWFGLNGACASIVIGSILALINAVIMKFAKNKPVFGVYYPFGPFLYVGLLIWVFHFLIR